MAEELDGSEESQIDDILQEHGVAGGCEAIVRYLESVIREQAVKLAQEAERLKAIVSVFDKKTN